ncbi:MAG: cytochrome b/b6 domain-containing protein [Acidimicrobiia bacterium]
MTTNRPEPTAPPGPAGTGALEEPIERFARAERVVHWANALLFVVVMLTGSALYVGWLSALVGHREQVRFVHVYAGLAIPVVIGLGLLGRHGAALRRDLERLNRWSRGDRRWFRAEHRRVGVRLGKFNPGQKLNAAFVGGAIVVMVLTGSIMRWNEPFSDSWRTGAQFAHDWFAFFIWCSVIGHVGLALADPVALRAMVRGSVPAAWARRERPRWYEEITGLPAEQSSGAPPSGVQPPAR